MSVFCEPVANAIRRIGGVSYPSKKITVSRILNLTAAAKSKSSSPRKDVVPPLNGQRIHRVLCCAVSRLRNPDEHRLSPSCYRAQEKIGYDDCDFFHRLAEVNLSYISRDAAR